MIPLYAIADYIVCFEALPEHIDFETYWMGECAFSTEQFNDIADYAWFCAKVSLWKDGEEVASDYVGACCYKEVKDFYTTYKSEYLAGMVNNCLRYVTCKHDYQMHATLNYGKGA